MKYDNRLRISVMIPTRKRTESLEKSVQSLIDNASSMEGIEFLIAIDEDDPESINFVSDKLVGKLNELKIAMRAYTFPRLGYVNLHNYINTLSNQSEGNWLFVWNDDAIMQSKNWDLEIEKFNGQMKVLRFKDNHNEHPNAIFPCVPRDWLMLFEQYSPHPHIDTWVSQIGYLTDCMQNVPSVEIFHDRHDLTGAEEDQTAKERELLISNPEDPRDINHVDFLDKKVAWSMKLNWYLHKTNQNTGWFDKFMQDRTFDVWAKYKEIDVNKQCFILKQ